MADDIDDLLDEVEASLAKRNSKKNGSSIKKTKTKADEDLDAIIDDICDTTQTSAEDAKLSQIPISGNKISGDYKRKCFTIFLGGSSLPFGITTSVNQRACDKLRCTDCDFKISVFEGFMWDPTTDYLFLRNNMPDFSRLKSKLVSKSGYRAYACQCKSVSINSMRDLRVEKELKWVCGMHD